MASQAIKLIRDAAVLKQPQWVLAAQGELERGIALSGEPMKTEDVLRLVHNREAHICLFVRGDDLLGVMVYSVRQLFGDVLCWLVAGRMSRDWRDRAYRELQRAARAAEVSRIVAFATPMMAAKAAEWWGFEMTHVRIVKNIEPKHE